MNQLQSPKSKLAPAWPPSQLVTFSQSLGNAFNFGLGADDVSLEHDRWSAKKLARLGEVLAHGFHPGI